METMNRERTRLLRILALCLLIPTVLGGLMGWALHRDPVLAAVLLGLIVVAGALAWLLGRWWASGRSAAVRRWLKVQGWRVSRLPWIVLGVLAGAAIISSLIGLLGTDRGMPWLWLNLGVELAGAVVTYILLDLVLGARERKEALIRSVASNARDVAVPAAAELRRQGWLTDGSLQGARLGHADLAGANLEGAELRASNLQEAKLMGSNLERAGLEGANLRGAHLVEANLQAATLVDADLRHALMVGANLGGANLTRAKLQQAKLTNANLQGALLVGADLTAAVVTAGQLAQAQSLRGTTLQDGTQLGTEDWEAVFEAWRERQEGATSADPGRVAATGTRG
jgi:hypothetical protein